MSDSFLRNVNDIKRNLGGKDSLSPISGSNSLSKNNSYNSSIHNTARSRISFNSDSFSVDLLII
jgi:hypothetical protein